MKRPVTIKHQTFKKNRLYMLAILPMMMSSPVLAQDVIWIGPNGGSFWEETNWLPNQLPSLDNNLFINGSASGQTAQLTFDDMSGSLSGSQGSLTVGNGIGARGTLNIYIADTGYGGQLDAPVIIGNNGAIGTLNYTENSPERDFNTAVTIQTLLLGSGIQSQGVANILGSGKQTYDQNAYRSMLLTSDMTLATEGGQATLNLNGGSITVAGERNDYQNENYVFSLGHGNNSVGEVNVLGGGKLGISLYSYGSPLVVDQSGVVGINGGQGTLNISGTVQGVDGNRLSSRATFAQGLAVGSGAGSSGNINVVAGGMLRTMSSWSTAPSDYLTQIGVNGGTGAVSVSGTGSRWEVAGIIGDPYAIESGTVGALYLGDSGAGSLTIANEGVVAIGRTALEYKEYEDPDTGNYFFYQDYNFITGGGTLFVATQLGSQGTLNIGAPLTGSAVKAGTLEADNIVFGAGQGTIVFNHTDVYYNFIPALYGQGTILHQAGITRLLSESGPSFTGNTEINGGILAVEGSLGGTLSVNNGGTLAGAGTVGSTTIRAGGTIAPGLYGGQALNSYSSYSPLTSYKINIDGNFVMDFGATYLLNISPTHSNLINVQGSASLDYPSVVLLKQGDIYQVGSRWHILSTTNGVQGQFSPVLEDLPYLKFDYEYDQNNAYLVLNRSEVDFCDPNSMTVDECSVGNDIEVNHSALIFLYNLIASQQSIAAARNALNQLSGEVYASIKTVTFEDSYFLREAMNKRLMTPTPVEGATAWAHGFGSWARIDDVKGHTDGVKRDIGGIFMGVDKNINAQWQIGGILGYSRASIQSNNMRSKSNRDDYHLGVYVGGEWDAWKLRTGVGYTWHDFSTTRNVAFPGLVDHLRADYRGSTTQVFAEGSHQFKLSDASLIEPFINVAYVYVTTNDFNERGGEARLNGSKAHDDLFYSTIGVRGSHRFDLANGKDLQLWGTLGWRHAYGNNRFSQIDLHFPNTTRFRIEGAPIAKNTAMLEVGMETNLSPSIKMGLQYQGQIASKTQDHGGSIYVRWHF